MDILVIYASISPFKIQLYDKELKEWNFKTIWEQSRFPSSTFLFSILYLFTESLLDLPGKGFSYLENKKDGKTKEIPALQMLPKLANWFQTENPVPWAPFRDGLLPNQGQNPGYWQANFSAKQAKHNKGEPWRRH